MKKLIIPFLIFNFTAHAQIDSSFKRHSVSAFGNFGFANFKGDKKIYLSFQSAFHYTYFINRKVGFGGEISYQKTNHPSIKFNTIGALGFVRFNLPKNFYTELGIMANKNLNNNFGQNQKMAFNFYAAVGYELKLKGNWFINFQLRTNPKFNEGSGLGINPFIGIGFRF